LTLFRILILAASNVAIAAAVYFYSDHSDPIRRAPMSDGALNGQQVWRENGCTSCHAILGLGGHAGPDLTNVISRRGPIYSQSVIEFGIGIMPAREIGEADMADLLLYLEHVDGQAVYPIRDFPDGSFGARR
jgi:mono/diheme cytochrome c family protein